MRGSDTAKARLLLVVLILGRGITWPLMRIALAEIPPLAMRAGNVFVGAITLIALAAARGQHVGFPRRGLWLHVLAAAFLNIVIFSMLTPFAQLGAETSRVAILVYTMPIWASLLARPVLGERLDAIRIVALLLCAGGMAILVVPLLGFGLPLGLLFALGASLSWAVGTVYVKWARFNDDPLAITIWQLMVGSVAIGACVPIFESLPPPSGLHAVPLLAFFLTGLFGSGISNFLWFDIIRRLPAATASLAILGVPVVGVLSSALLLAERPTATDIIGFAMILVASACVLLLPHVAMVRSPERDET